MTNLRTTKNITLALLAGVLGIACSVETQGIRFEDQEATAEGDGDGEETPEADGKDEPGADEDQAMPTGDGDGDGAGMGGAPGDEAEPEPQIPVVVGSSVEDGATGVHYSESIVIEFSEPMNKESVEASYESNDLQVDFVEFKWNEDGTILTIDPNEELKFAVAEIGTDPGELPDVTYSFALDSDARSAEGIRLDEDYEVTFQMGKGVIREIPSTVALSGSVRSDSQAFGSVWVGDAMFELSEDGPDTQYLGIVSFDYEELGTEILSFEGAILQMTEHYVSPGCFEELGTIELFDVEFDEKSWDAVSTEVEGAEALMKVADAPTNSGVQLVVSESAWQDYQAGRMSQFALAFTTPYSDDEQADYVTFTYPKLRISYWVE